MIAVAANQSPPAIAIAKGLASQFMLRKRAQIPELFVSGIINSLASSKPRRLLARQVCSLALTYGLQIGLEIFVAIGRVFFVADEFVVDAHRLCM